MILHIVSASPFRHDTLQRCLSLASEQDGILLIEDGVFALTNPVQHLPQPLPTHHMFALASDLQARGIDAKTNTSITIVDYEGFVTLATQFSKTLTWF